jgi:hypothetical protein
MKPRIWRDNYEGWIVTLQYGGLIKWIVTATFFDACVAAKYAIVPIWIEAARGLMAASEQ